MIIGSTNVDKSFLMRNFKYTDKIIEYSNSLIPDEFRHIKELRDNQLYYICMTLRKLGLSDYRALHNSIHTLLKGVRITGYVDDVLEVSLLYNLVNRDKVNLYLERL